VESLSGRLDEADEHQQAGDDKRDGRDADQAADSLPEGSPGEKYIDNP
jgi:hypothetical protein